MVLSLSLEQVGVGVSIASENERNYLKIIAKISPTLFLIYKVFFSWKNWSLVVVLVASHFCLRKLIANMNSLFYQKNLSNLFLTSQFVASHFHNEANFAVIFKYSLFYNFF